MMRSYWVVLERITVETALVSIDAESEQAAKEDALDGADEAHWTAPSQQPDTTVYAVVERT